MSSEKSEENNTNINSENIFDEFTHSSDIKQELEIDEKKKSKDIYYFLKKTNSFFLSLNIILFFVFIVSFAYIYIQNTEDKIEYPFLASLCSYILGNDSISSGTCYGVTPLLDEYTIKSNDLSSSLSDQILPLLGDTYSFENYNLSKKVDFLLNKSENRLEPFVILSEFDKMKDVFSSTDKLEISCYDINISSDIISITCDSFSSDWNTDIQAVENTLLKPLNGGGTSISKASSFINFFEKYSDSPFTIVEKPDYFNSETYQSGPYTRRTTFQFSMKYTKLNNFEKK